MLLATIWSIDGPSSTSSAIGRLGQRARGPGRRRGRVPVDRRAQLGHHRQVVAEASRAASGSGSARSPRRPWRACQASGRSPRPTNTVPKRRTGFAAVLACAVSAGTMASRNGRATVAPTPRRIARRESDFSRDEHDSGSFALTSGTVRWLTTRPHVPAAMRRPRTSSLAPTPQPSSASGTARCARFRTRATQTNSWLAPASRTIARTVGMS